MLSIAGTFSTSGTVLNGCALRQTLNAASLADAMLTACAPVTIERTGDLVVVAANGSVLSYSATEIIDRAHEAVKKACDWEAYVQARVTSDDPIVRPPFQRRLSFNLLENVGLASEAAEEAKAILDLFGSHSYSATLGCQSSPEPKTMRLLTHRRKHPSL